MTSLKAIFYGAAPFTVPALRNALDKLPGCGFVQGYGMTETCLVTLLPEIHHSVSGDAVHRLASVGQTSAFAEIKIVDTQDQEVPVDTIGEILIRAPSVMKGYWGQPELTEQSVQDHWMHSGDAGYFDSDGFLYLVDRLKDMIVTGGENVYSSEVEAALSSHSAVLQCAVVGRADDHWGEIVHAVVVAKPDQQVTESELIEHCKALISGYKVPRRVEFRSSLPLSAAGKNLKSELK